MQPQQIPTPFAPGNLLRSTLRKELGPIDFTARRHLLKSSGFIPADERGRRPEIPFMDMGYEVRKLRLIHASSTIL